MTHESIQRIIRMNDPSMIHLTDLARFLVEVLEAHGVGPGGTQPRHGGVEDIAGLLTSGGDKHSGSGVENHVCDSVLAETRTRR